MDDNNYTVYVDPRGEWPEPQPLTAKIQPEPYPIASLPKTVREAIAEVQGFVKAPLPLVANSAFGALSLAIQPHVNIRRAVKLEGPTSLFLLAIADSGERKTTCDGFFTQAIQFHEIEQADAAKPLMEDFDASLAAWEAKRDGLLAAIKQAAKSGNTTDELENNLRNLERDKPDKPLSPRIILADETPENLAWSLAKLWPSSGVVSSEAGAVLGSHGMGKDSIKRNLALLNVLWDGGTLPIGRKTSESFTVRDVRLTVALQIQESTLQDFFDSSKGLPRGTGFLARFLIAWPDSTQGTRFFSEPPENMPALAAFNRRITEILKKELRFKRSGGLDPFMLDLSTEAKAEWVGFYDGVEAQLRNGGELYDVRDVASKTADNAVRLAALFQVFEHGLEGKEVAVDSLIAGAHVALWHLSESRRFFGELAYPQDIADAAKLNAWLIGQWRNKGAREVPKNHIRQHGPNPLRGKQRLDGALEMLCELGRARLFKEGKRVIVELNPALKGEP